MYVRPRNELPGKKKRRFSPPQILAIGFLTLILIGAFLLKLPAATTESITWLDAFFTATSATTVTGLIVVDTGGAFTRFGEIIILSLIQIGGLGIVSFATFIFIMFGGAISFRHRLVVSEGLNQTSFGGIFRLVKSILLFSLVFEALLFIIFAVRWVPEMGWGKGLYYSIFYALSAFYGAGFSLWPNSLSNFTADPLINLVVTTAFIISGLGFTVLLNLREARRIHDLTLHTKMMLFWTLIINIFAFLMIFTLEFNNPQTLGKLPMDVKILGAYFQAVTPRSAGFNTLPIGEMNESSLFFIMILMFIGAGSTSTAGGIKLTTFIALLLSVITVLKGKQESVVFSRTISDSIIVKAFAVAVTAICLILVSILILAVTESASFLEIAFEVLSGFGTVGLSMGLTGDLSAVGKLVIMILMFVGKIGPLALVFSLAKPQLKKIRYPDGKLLIG